MHVALTIAGSDSSGGAGIQADLKTFAAFGVHGASAITAVTAQNDEGVAAAFPLPADLVTAQIEAVAGDFQIGATKVGMLATAAIVEAVVAAIEELELQNVVVDPVLRSTSGAPLLDDDGVAALGAELLPRAFVVTPNLPEAEALSGMRVDSMDDARDAARRIADRGVRFVVVTGGHRAGDDVVDLLFDGRAFHEFRTPRIEGGPAHGSGCTFASAVAAGLALGRSPAEAVGGAQRYVAGAIRHRLAIGRGHGLLDHFWQSRTSV